MRIISKKPEFGRMNIVESLPDSKLVLELSNNCQLGAGPVKPEQGRHFFVELLDSLLGLNPWELSLELTTHIE